jgi:hypothetical protein
VYYNPANPAQSCLEPGPNYFFLIFGGLMTLLISAIGAVGILMDLRKPRFTLPQWLAHIAVAPVEICDDDIVEAQSNMCGFGLSEKQRGKLTPTEIEEFIRAIASARGSWLTENGLGPMRFYCWNDGQAGQLRFSLVSVSTQPLPFGCRFDPGASLGEVVREFLLGKEAPQSSPLAVWVTTVP